MDDYVTKFEKRPCLSLPLADFPSKETYAIKMTD